MDYDVQRSTRDCRGHRAGVALGEEFYSALVAEGNELRRLDDPAPDAWQMPAARRNRLLQSLVPPANAKRPHQAPNDVPLQFFDELAEQPGREDMGVMRSRCCWSVAG